ncbi:hypothetical protein ACN47E_004024 [Coniothyrium glycines]
MLNMYPEQGVPSVVRSPGVTGSLPESSSGGLVGLPGSSQLVGLGLDSLNHTSVDGNDAHDILTNFLDNDYNFNNAECYQTNPDATLASYPSLTNDAGFDFDPLLVRTGEDILTQPADLVDTQGPYVRDQFQDDIWNAQISGYAPQDFNVPSMGISQDYMTPGFSAMPGGYAATLQPAPTYPQLQTYCDPQDLSQYGQPYYLPVPTSNSYQNTGYYADTFRQPLQPSSQVYEGYIPMSDEQIPPTHRRSSGSPAAQYDDTMTQSKRKGPRSESDEGNDAPVIKRQRKSQLPDPVPTTEARRPRNDSTASESTIFEQPVELASPVRAGELPTKVVGKDHVRINTSTKGQTTRTARINQYSKGGSKYTYRPLPDETRDGWKTDRYTFEYKHYSEWGMDELKKHTMSASEIFEYITQYPGSNLRLWLQRTPADSNRRYPAGHYANCRFEDCPNRQWANKGTIEVGQFRVAFDEKHRYGTRVDPFDCTMYVHLYCLERFVDFAVVCQVADVRVEDRTYMSKEPKGVPKFIFGSKHDAEKTLAERFVKAAKHDALQRTPEFRDYPVHSDYKKGKPKPHERTLTYALYERNIRRPPSQMKQFVIGPNRKEIGVTSFLVHMGDKEIELLEKKVKAGNPTEIKAWTREGKKARDFPYTDYFEPWVVERIMYWQNVRKDLLAGKGTENTNHSESKRQTKSKAAEDTISVRSSRKRKIILLEDSDEETDFEVQEDEDFDDYPAQQRTGTEPTRRSIRKKQRVNYVEDGDSDHRFGQQLLQHSNPQQQSQYSQAAHYPQSAESRKLSATDLFPANQIYSVDDFAPPEGKGDAQRKLSWNVDREVEALLSQYPLEDQQKSLQRRKSSGMGTESITSILKSPKLSHSPPATRSWTRTASFNDQPVSSSKEYHVDDPPTHVATSPNLTNRLRDHHLQGRRSARIASRGKSPPAMPDKVETGRVSKHQK